MSEGKITFAGLGPMGAVAYGKRKAPHRSWDPRRAKGAQKLATALELHKSGNADAAAQIYMELEQQYSPHWHARMLGGLLHYERTSDPSEVIPLLIGVTQAIPKWPDPFYNLGVVYEGLGDYERAETYFKKCLKIEPNHAPAWVNLGNVQIALGEVEEADLCFAHALRIDPGSPLGLYNLMHVRGLQGRWEECYHLHELRWLTPGHLRNHGLPRMVQPWDGITPVDHLIVSDEQGAGDIIQFCRFLPLLKERSGATKLTCTIRHPALIPLLAHNFPEIDFVAHKNDDAPEADAHIPLLSVIDRLKITEEQVAGGRTYYLRAPQRPPIADRPTVGVSWAGSKMHKRDGVRSMPWEAFRPLLDLPGIRWVNLTLNEKGQVDDSRLIDVRSECADYLASASLVQSLDAVVTVDTSTLHLAGALGVPTLALIPAAPDFRWGLNRSDTPWYRSVELIRQAKAGEWSAVIERAKARLQEMLWTSL